MLRSGRADRFACLACTAAILCHAAAASAQPPVTALRFHIEAPAPAEATLRARFTPDQIAVLEMLNRADAAHLSGLDALVVPGTWPEDVLRYSPFPQRYPWAASQPKLLVVDQRWQAFAAYESGALVRWGPISSGRRQLQTPAGLFHLTWRSPGRHSTVDPDWFMPWYFNFHNDRGLSFHEFTLPGRLASHACVRLLERDARWLFDWGETWTLDERGWTVLDPGTPVLILGCYDFDVPPPWRTPVRLETGVTLPADPATEPFQCGAVSGATAPPPPP